MKSSMSSSNLRKRCRTFINLQMRDAVLRQDDPVEDLVAFVVSEIGRAANEKFDESYPLCLYFGNQKDIDEFVDAVRAAKPGMISKRWPR